MTCVGTPSGHPDQDKSRSVNVSCSSHCVITAGLTMLTAHTHTYSSLPTTVDLIIVCVIFHSKSVDPHTTTFHHSNVDLSDSKEDISES